MKVHAGCSIVSIFFFSSRIVLLWFSLFVYLYQLLCKPHAYLILYLSDGFEPTAASHFLLVRYDEYGGATFAQ